MGFQRASDPKSVKLTAEFRFARLDHNRAVQGKAQGPVENNCAQGGGYLNVARTE
jgi:hypothetical protein